jgi:hypothetical protein
MALGEEHLKGLGLGILSMHLSENHLPDTIYHLRIPSQLGPEIWSRSVLDPNLGALVFCGLCFVLCFCGWIFLQWVISAFS